MSDFDGDNYGYGRKWTEVAEQMERQTAIRPTRRPQQALARSSSARSTIPERSPHWPKVATW